MPRAPSGTPIAEAIRKKKVGTKLEVWVGIAQQTAGGLRKDDLTSTRGGKVVSIKQQERSRQLYEVNPKMQRGMAAPDDWDSSSENDSPNEEEIPAPPPRKTKKVRDQPAPKPIKPQAPLIPEKKGTKTNGKGSLKSVKLDIPTTQVPTTRKQNRKK